MSNSHYPQDIYLGFPTVDGDCIRLLDRFLQRFLPGMVQVMEDFPMGLTSTQIVAKLQERVHAGESATAYWSRAEGSQIISIDVTITTDGGLILGLGCQERFVDRVLARLEGFVEAAIVAVVDERPPPQTLGELRLLERR